MRIAFILPTFAAGGAERVANLLCNYWAEQGHDVTALTFEGAGDEQIYALDKRVALVGIDALNRSRGVASRVLTNARRVFRLRAELKAFGPDAVVAFTTEANVVAICSAMWLGVPVVVSERNQPDRPGLGRFTRAARRLSYPLATALVVQTAAIAEWSRARFAIPVHVVPNPVRLASWVEVPRTERATKQIVAAGRLVPQKGFDVLIASFAALADAFPDWRLVIYGEGVQREGLEAEARRHALGERIALPGIRKDMPAALAAADLFVLSSRYEGYPNVLLEALASGCAVVATDCPGATAEILEGGKYGLLVEPGNVTALTAALERMMSDETLRRRFAAQAREAVSALDVGTVGRRWLELMSALVRR
jgi:GalNAc-alpha-(1->4)-GalNAc-alpha-(1->3)-diNAcBac-PP-undecaprenol alpha-1,4-N-acetyl-D-galactosaminyltransferase